MAWATVPTPPPLAIGDAYWVYQGNRLTVSGSGVLGDDHDQESDSLTAAVVDLPTHGSLTLNSDGSLTYDPDSGYIGSDSFTYVAPDAQTKSIKTTVTVDVRTAPVNTAGSTVGSTVGTTVGSTIGG
jgi:VCBS repeat-containing protein